MVRFGIIGAGPNASGHARFYHQSDRAEVVAVADPDAERGKKLADEVDARHVADFNEFLGDVDAVVISSPNFLHRDHALACVEAGRHVYIEKPMGINLEEAKQIVDAIDAAGVQSDIGFSVRHSDVVRHMVQRIEAGDIGELVSVWSRRLHFIDPAKRAGWRLDHSLSGGLLYEINIHELDWMMLVGGEVDNVFARTAAVERQGPRSNDHLWVNLGFAGGAVGTHEGSWYAAAPNMYIGLHGSKGAVYSDEWRTRAFYQSLGSNREELDKIDARDKGDLFLDAIETGQPTLTDAHWGLKVMAVGEAVLESARRGQVVRLSELMAATT